MKSFFTPKNVASIVGISYRQMQYWDKTGFIRPSYRRAGKYRLYTFHDLMILKSAKMLRAGGFSIQELRRMMKRLRALLLKITFPLSEARIFFHEDAILLFSSDVLVADAAARAVDPLIFSAPLLRREIDVLYPDDALGRAA